MRKIHNIKLEVGLRWAITIGITLLFVPGHSEQIEQPWKEQVQAIPYFANHTITSLGVDRDLLFIGSTVAKGNSYSVRVSVMDLKSKQTGDLTQELVTEYDGIIRYTFDDLAAGCSGCIGSGGEEDAQRQCALGNPAACSQ